MSQESKLWRIARCTHGQRKRITSKEWRGERWKKSLPACTLVELFGAMRERCCRSVVAAAAAVVTEEYENWLCQPSTRLLMALCLMVRLWLKVWPIIWLAVCRFMVFHCCVSKLVSDRLFQCRSSFHFSPSTCFVSPTFCLFARFASFCGCHSLELHSNPLSSRAQIRKYVAIVRFCGSDTCCMIRYRKGTARISVIYAFAESSATSLSFSTWNSGE